MIEQRNFLNNFNSNLISLYITSTVSLRAIEIPRGECTTPRSPYSGGLPKVERG